MSAVYGCHNRAPLKDKAVVQAGWHRIIHPHTEARVITTIPDPMTKDCQYTHSDLGHADARCAGCRHKAGLLAPEARP